MEAQKGFTIIEFILVIAIIAVLAGIVLSGVSSYQVKSRNVARKTELREMQKALDLYYTDNGSYPTTINSWYGTCSNYGGKDTSGSNGYIPNLAPKYIGKLPIDPGGNGSADFGWCVTDGRCYLYRSDGVSYKLLAHCTPEGLWDSSDPFYDLVRPSWAWMVCKGETACNIW